MPISRRHILGGAGIAALGAVTLPNPAHGVATKKFDPTLGTTPQKFGAVGDGVADDTDAIQQAIDAQVDRTEKIVYFPPGTYRITRTLVVPDREASGGGHLNRLVLAGAGTMGSRTSIIQVDFDGTALHIAAALSALRGLCFVVAPRLKNSVAVHAARDAGLGEAANTDDVDATITECTFIEFYTAVKHVGRGLVFTNNLVAVGDFGLDISWPTAGVAGSGVHLLPYGMRKWLIEGNHFHSMGTAIMTTGADAANFRGAIISNNILDIGRRLFSGGVINSTFAGNVIENGSNGPSIDVTSGGTNLTFTGNVIGGSEPPEDKQPPFAIEFSKDVNARNVTVTGNSFNWVKRSPVYFGASASQITISANSFDHWNLEVEESWSAVRINGDADQISIMGNILGANPVSGSPPVRVIGTISNSSIVGNTFSDATSVVYASTIGEGNHIVPEP